MSEERAKYTVKGGAAQEGRQGLKPCPFCGECAQEYENYDGTWVIQCNACGIRTMNRHDRERIKKEWNMRA